QEAEACTTGAGEAIDFSFVSFSVGVDVDGDRLADFHLTKLGLFEVGRDPDVVERDDLHQFLAGGDVLSDFDGAIADDAGNRRCDFRVLQIQLSLIEVGFLAQGIGQGGGGLGSRDLQLLRAGLGVAPVSFSLRQFCLGLIHLCLGGVDLGAGGIYGGGAGFGG